MTNRDLFRLALLVFAAVTFVVLGDTAGKILTSSGVDPFFVAFTRFAIAAPLLLPFSGVSWSELPKLLDKRILLRACVIAAAICCILTGLKTAPIANVFGAFFVGPIVSYLLAIQFLGETPSRNRNLLLIIGFVGVLLVVKPGFGATLGMMFALIAGVLYGVYLAATRVAAQHFRPRFLLLSQLLIGTVVLAPLGLTTIPSSFDFGLGALIVASALASAIGNFMLVIANKTAEASLVAPLVYTQLISATLVGAIVFSELPDAIALIGLVLIVVSGLGSLALRRSEQRC